MSRVRDQIRPFGSGQLECQDCLANLTQHDITRVQHCLQTALLLLAAPAAPNMLSRSSNITARAVHITIPRFFNARRPLVASVGRPCYAAATRTLHSATAKFTNLGPEGTPVTKDVSIVVGNPGASYVIIPQKSAMPYRLKAAYQIRRRLLPSAQTGFR
jgi:hypothetical protein